MNVIDTADAPDAVGAYSQGTLNDGLIRTSGQIGLHPKEGMMVNDTIEQEIQRTLENFLAVVRAGGGSISTVLQTRVYLTDLDHYSPLNELYRDTFTSPYPARTVVEVQSLPKQARIEIDGLASTGSS